MRTTIVGPRSPSCLDCTKLQPLCAGQAVQCGACHAHVAAYHRQSSVLRSARAASRLLLSQPQSHCQTPHVGSTLQGRECAASWKHRMRNPQGQKTDSLEETHNTLKAPVAACKRAGEHSCSAAVAEAVCAVLLPSSGTAPTPARQRASLTGSLRPSCHTTPFLSYPCHSARQVCVGCPLSNGSP